MIDLTPLDVRKKRGDFRKAFRGYDPEEVDTFLEMVAERLEALVTENRTLQERCDRLQERVAAQEGREKAIQEALVTAQELREEMRQQARREADLLRREAEGAAESVLSRAERRLEERKDAIREMERTRLRFLASFRALLERQLDTVEVEEGRSPLTEDALEIDFSVSDVRESLPDVPGTDEAPEVEAEAESMEMPWPQEEDDDEEAEAGKAAEPGSTAPSGTDEGGQVVDVAELAPELRPGPDEAQAGEGEEASEGPREESLWLLGDDDQR